jgi:hypothetical protein
MSYNPSDHAVGPRQIMAAWAVCVALLAIALGGNLGHASSDNGGIRMICSHGALEKSRSVS